MKWKKVNEAQGNEIHEIDLCAPPKIFLVY